MEKEPSVLDYLKSRLNPWQKEKIDIPAEAETASDVALADAGSEDSRQVTISLRVPEHLPWRTALALVFALAAQWMLEPPVASFLPVFLLYILAFGLLLWASMVGEFSLPASEAVQPAVDPQTFRGVPFIASMVLAGIAFGLFGGNLFTPVNVTLWLLAIAFFVIGLWLGNPFSPAGLGRFFAALGRESWTLTLRRSALLLLAASALIIFFRFTNLSGVPAEPFSDQAEKLLDVYDVMNGQPHIFFERNTGREFIQFYWTALMALVFNTGLSFMSLKIGTVLIGLFALPYVYLLGREVGGPRVAFFALLLAGTAYWLNTISRIGLRFPLYPAFAAPVLYHLVRGLRRQSRNDFILAGLFLGLGLHGYSPFRFVPFLVVLGVGIYLFHAASRSYRNQTALLFIILVLASVFVFLPLGRYSLENPSMFSYRALTRLTGEESPLPAPAWQIFASNTLKAMLMFNYDDGEIWVHSVPHRPALDFVSAVLFAIGYIFLFVRYLQKRGWLDLFLLLAVPMLLMPSILSLAFPGENPSLNRTGATAVVVFVVAALALDGLYTALRGVGSGPWRRGMAVGAVTLLLGVASLQNYTLVLVKFGDQFRAGAWNTSEMGQVIRGFVDDGNSPDNAFVVPYPYWVDTRLVGIQAGFPTKDYALWREDLEQSKSFPGNKLFIVKEEDVETMDVLREMYPTGTASLFTNPLEGKNFWIYRVPDSQPVTVP